MKKSLIVAVTSIVVSILLLFSNWSWRWVVIHGWSASNQAESMLAGRIDTADEFIDYIIYTAGGCVVFSEHDTEGRAMVYCPKGIPTETNKIGALTHLVGDWYTTQ
jgi:hypothetical protein